MNNELIQLAEEKGFNNSFVVHDNYGHLLSVEVQYLFWMTALQKWLREVHNIEIEIVIINLNPTIYGVTIFDKNWNKFFIENLENIDIRENDLYDFYSYEASLEEALYQALQLIK